MLRSRSARASDLGSAGEVRSTTERATGRFAPQKEYDRSTIALPLRIALASVVLALGLGGAIWVGTSSDCDEGRMGTWMHPWGKGGSGVMPMPGMGMEEPGAAGEGQPPTVAQPPWQMDGMMGGMRFAVDEFGEGDDAWRTGLAAALGIFGVGFAAAILACGSTLSGPCCRRRPTDASAGVPPAA